MSVCGSLHLSYLKFVVLLGCVNVLLNHIWEVFIHYFLACISCSFSLSGTLMPILVHYISLKLCSFFFIFSLCSSDCTISINLPSSSLVISSASNLLNPSSEFFHFSYCIFQLYNFRLVILIISISLLIFPI